ncbi:unnamed protein product [Nesidiocoris tenuis]|uniref:Uncharacterized protein n=1 Tax=Nesidiocoris tenuis TaxID=355587 RepID=A0A6H5GSG5_9HEMI|nr:unnamed protein product [Nesidiocoris tenuis]
MNSKIVYLRRQPRVVLQELELGPIQQFLQLPVGSAHLVQSPMQSVRPLRQSVRPLVHPERTHCQVIITNN